MSDLDSQEGEHIVLLQLGHQHKTSTPLFRFSMGLSTEKATFGPPRGPMEGEQGKYVVDGKVEWSGERVTPEEADAQNQLERVLRLTKDLWFGDSADDKVTNFEFTPPATNPTICASRIRLHLPSIRVGPSEVDLPKTLDARTGLQMEGEWLVLEGARTWGVEVGWEMVGPRGVQDTMS